MAMFASQGSYLLENLEIIYILIIPILMFFVINYVIGRLVGKFLKFTYEDSVSLSMTIIARNSPVSLAIAVRAFPNQPLIALALVIGPLIELPVLAIVSKYCYSQEKRVKIKVILYSSQDSLYFFPQNAPYIQDGRYSLLRNCTRSYYEIKFL